MALKDSLNRSNLNTLAEALREIGIGEVLRAQLPQVKRMVTPTAAAANLATVESIGLGEDHRASTILRAYARATNAAGTLGELAVQSYGTTPADGQVAVAPNGDIVVLAASDYDQVDVEYVPARGDVVALRMDVAANVATIPAAYAALGVVYLLSVNATGGASGEKIVLVPGAAAPAAGQARLNLAKTTITFAAADAITSCTARLLVTSSKDLDTLLEADSTIG